MTMRMELVTALFGSIAVAACTGSPATLAIPPDFELETPQSPPFRPEGLCGT